MQQFWPTMIQAAFARLVFSLYQKSCLLAKVQMNVEVLKTLPDWQGGG
jgi:hypothetical protein